MERKKGKLFIVSLSLVVFFNYNVVKYKYMKKLITIILILSLFSCSKDNGLFKSSGTKLVSIDYTEDDNSWVENYTYDSDNKLVRLKIFGHWVEGMNLNIIMIP